MLQGALLSEEANAPDTLIAGVLLHDIGHYIYEFSHAAFVQDTDDCHDKVGAALLALFSQQWSLLALNAMLRPNVFSAQPNQTILIGCHRHRFIRCTCKVVR
jgi:predicted HD phosphohydrolase